MHYNHNTITCWLSVCIKHVNLLHTLEISSVIIVVLVSLLLSKQFAQTNPTGIPPSLSPQSVRSSTTHALFSIHTFTRSCSFVGATVTSLVRGLSHDVAIKVGLRAAFTSLHSPRAVSEELNSSFLDMNSISSWAPWKSVQVL